MRACALTAHGDGSRRGQVSVLSVHVVGSTARVVTQPDTKVLHLQRGLLVDLQQARQGGQTGALQPHNPRCHPRCGSSSSFLPSQEYCGCLNSLWRAQWRCPKATGSSVAVCTPDKLTPRRGGVSFGFGCRTDRRTDGGGSTHQAAVDNLPGRLLHLPQLGHKVPEAGLGHHVVRGKDPHAVKGRGRVLGRGQQTANHFVFAKLRTERQTVS